MLVGRQVMAQLDTAQMMGLVPMEMRNDTAHPDWQDPALLAALKDTQVRHRNA